tara:strand:- start:199 stop:558 length:360 start_codon:yes stop_codon:yes gene_type:complete
MELDKDYLKKIWDSVWEENLSELEVQKRYFAKLDMELKGENRFHLIALGRKIDELEMKVPFSNLLEKEKEFQNDRNGSAEIKDPRIEGDGTEWIIEKDGEGKLFKREIGSKEKIYLENK